MTNAEWGLDARMAIRHSSLAMPGLPNRILIWAIQLYRWTISPLQIFLFGPTGGCRFTPTCSEYAMEAVRARGALAGGWLATRRICRCHPWSECGHDPVPEKESGIRHSEFEI
jgi:putative membrane protein insertion efficiency factor